ncbi:flavin reductase family protein [Novosphingobium sp.]|uniref:flavin reductase family protein n=1 Tax=Novosphingobium sp. TaxID=1874826 RepID=UPI003342D1F8
MARRANRNATSPGFAGIVRMHFDFSAMPAGDRYRLMAAAITPRPIAWVTSQSAAGARNAAPYSFFNMMGADPPIVAIGMMRRGDGTHKDSAANVLETREFVVNLVGEPNAAAMNLTSIDAPPGTDEIALAQLAIAESLAVAPPRIASAPVAMECRVYQAIEIGTTTLVIGQVLYFHVQDRFYDPARRRIDTPAMQLIGRVHGASSYARATDLFDLQRPNWADYDPAG